MLILVVNAGSSSLKYQVRDTSLPEAEADLRPRRKHRHRRAQPRGRIRHHVREA